MAANDYTKPEYFTNRELSWLDFNMRILGEARDKTNPLFERLKFLSITASNLDEFFMVRVASLKDMENAGYTKKDLAGLTPTQQLEAITALGRKLKKTSASLDSHIDAEIQRLTKSLAESIEGSIKDSCDKELAKVGEATQVLHDYSDKVKQQHRKFERLEGLKFGLFIFSSISSPIVLILLILNMLHII